MRTLIALAALAMVAPLALGGCDVSPPATVPRALEPFDGVCTIHLAPDAAIADVVAEQGARWAQATGCALELGTGPVVMLVDDVPRGDGTQSRGTTLGDRSATLIHRHGRDIPRTVLHELGHLLGADHVDTMGVMSNRKGYAAAIDAASLAAVCEVIPCAAFRPEAP
jgi:hypothetical protein